MAAGGAVFSEGDAKLAAETIEFSENRAEGSDAAYGDALTAHRTIEMTAADSISFSSNAAEGMEAAGGALFGAGDVILRGSTVTFRANTVTGRDGAAGGAICAGGSVDIAASGALTFDGNSVAAAEDGAACGGAIWANGDISLKADTITVATSTDTFWSNGGSVTISGNLTAAPGATFAAPSGDVTMSDGILTLAGVKHADDVKAGELTGFAGQNVTLDYTALAVDGADTVGQSYDFAVVAIDAQGNSLYR